MNSKHQLFRVVTGAVIHDGQGRFLMAQRHAKDDDQPDFWAIPAGHVEVDGPLDEGIPEALEENLKREVMEEVGVEIYIKGYLDSHFWVNTDYKKVTIVFLCTIKSGEPKPLDDTQAVAWMTLDEIKNLNLAQQVLRLITKASAMLTWAPKRKRV